MGKKIFIMLSLAVLLWAGCSDELEPPLGVSDLPPRPETPRGLTASIGNGQIVLKWAVSNPAAISQYVIYYSDSAAIDMLVFDSTAHLSDTIDGLVNGRRYYFRVAAVDTNNLQGLQSTPVSAVPGIFSILIAGGAVYTNTRSVTITLTAPAGTGLVRLSEDPRFTGAHWDNFTGGKPFELSDGDGAKTVYAEFELEAGGNSIDMVSDDIILDRSAVIDDFKVFVDGDVELVRDTLLNDGDTLRFEIHVSEEGSSASVNISDLGPVILNDYGIGGDLVSGDNIYGAIFIIPYGSEVRNNIMKARFTDVADNLAPEVQSPVRLSVTSVPPPVTLWGFAVSSSEVQLVWNPTPINDFSRYRIFRSHTDPAIDSTLVIQITRADDSRFFDAGLNELTGYYYWIYVDDLYGNTARSLTINIQTLENKPPDTLMIIVERTGDSTSARVSWAAAAAAEDFKSYYVLRDRQALPEYDVDDHTSYPENKIIKFIGDKQTTSHLDTHLPDTGLYFYQVYVVDRQGMVSRSNQDTIRVP